MPVSRFDHAAIPTSDPEAMIAFYRALGFSIVNEEAWRSGERRTFSIAFGDNKINVHAPELWHDPAVTLRGPTAVPGCGDFCFVWDGSVEEARKLFESAGGEIIAGPVQRIGGRGMGSTEGTSIYTRDPDGNLLELIVYV